MSREPLERAAGLDGAFNNVTLLLAPGAKELAVIAALDRLLAPLVRVGPRGERSSFRETTWDDALVRARDGLASAIELGGGTSVLPWHYMGTQGVLQGGPAMDAGYAAKRLGQEDLAVRYFRQGLSSAVLGPGAPQRDLARQEITDLSRHWGGSAALFYDDSAERGARRVRMS